MRKVNQIVLLITFSLYILFSYQNCSQVHFSEAADLTQSSQDLASTSDLEREATQETDNNEDVIDNSSTANKSLCSGTWSSCSTPCGDGIQMYQATDLKVDMMNGCHFKDNDIRACNNGICPVAPAKNCEYKISECTKSCGGGTRTVTITAPATGGGTCEYTEGQTLSCAEVACPVVPKPVDCVGSWGNCIESTGLQMYFIKQPMMNNGKACEAEQAAIRKCDVNCVGSFGACRIDGTKVYVVTTEKKNNGISCAYENGYVSREGCAQPPPPKNCYQAKAVVSNSNCKVSGCTSRRCPSSHRETTLSQIDCSNGYPKYNGQYFGRCTFTYEAYGDFEGEISCEPVTCENR